MSFASTSRRDFRVPLRTRLPLGSFVVGWRAARTTSSAARSSADSGGPRQIKAGGAGQSGEGVTFFALTRGGVLTSRCERACSVGFGGVGPRGVSGALRCAGVAKALFGSPRVGGVAGVSSKLTLEIVCVRLAMSDGGFGSVADILLPAVIPKISKCENLRLRARVGASALCWVVQASQVRVENGPRLARYESFADKAEHPEFASVLRPLAKAAKRGSAEEQADSSVSRQEQAAALETSAETTPARRRALQASHLWARIKISHTLGHSVCSEAPSDAT